MVVIINSDWRYDVREEEGKYYIKNNYPNDTSLPFLLISVCYIHCGEKQKEIQSFKLFAEEEIQLDIDHITGDIGIFVGNEDTYNTLIKKYEQYIKVIVNLTKQLLCGDDDCGCNDCDKECEEAKKFLSLFSLYTSYFIVNNPQYDIYFQAIATKLKCSFNEDIIHQIDSILLKGSVKNKFYLKKIIAYYYLVLYLQESLQTNSEEEAEYIKKKFLYLEISKCIRKLGINPDDVVEIILDNMKVQYWQFTNTVSDINTVITGWTPTYIDSLVGVDTRPFEDFEQGVIVPYTNVGRVGFAISPSQLKNYTILDSLGNDVTDSFDNYYFPIENVVVFVSKITYTFSNIYFKFKKNVYF